MPAIRLYDISNMKIGATQILGASALDVVYGKRVVTTNTDGTAGVGARDKAAFYADATLTGQDPATFAALLGLFEASGSEAGLACVAEGRVANAANHRLVTMNRMKLLSAGLDFQQGSDATTRFDLKNSASSSSSEASDEIAQTNVASPTVTASAALRGYRVIAASFNDGTTKTPLGVMGFNLNVQFASDVTVGDEEYGEIVDTGGWDVTGGIVFKDVTLTGAQTVSQVLLDAGIGTLDLTWKQANGGADKVMRINRVQFFEERGGLVSRGFNSNAMAFGCTGISGSTIYKLSTDATNNIFVMDPA